MNKIKKLLIRIKLDNLNRDKLIQKFQKIIWEDEDINISNTQKEILSELAYDLDYYESDIEKRAEDITFYGDEKLIIEIDNVLKKL